MICASFRVRCNVRSALHSRWRSTGKHPAAKPLKGYGGAQILEVVEDYDGDTYRAVYTVRFAGVLYVLHCFQKKATRGIKTTHRDIEMIKTRLAQAQQEYSIWRSSQQT